MAEMKDVFGLSIMAATIVGILFGIWCERRSGWEKKYLKLRDEKWRQDIEYDYACKIAFGNCSYDWCDRIARLWIEGRSYCSKEHLEWEDIQPIGFVPHQSVDEYVLTLPPNFTVDQSALK